MIHNVWDYSLRPPHWVCQTLGYSAVIGEGYFFVNNILNVLDQMFPGLVSYDTIQCRQIWLEKR